MKTPKRMQIQKLIHELEVQMQLQNFLVPYVKLMLQSYCQFGISIKMLDQEVLVHSILHI